MLYPPEMRSEFLFDINDAMRRCADGLRLLREEREQRPPVLTITRGARRSIVGGTWARPNGELVALTGAQARLALRMAKADGWLTLKSEQERRTWHGHAHGSKRRSGGLCDVLGSFVETRRGVGIHFTRRPRVVEVDAEAA